MRTSRLLVGVTLAAALLIGGPASAVTPSQTGTVTVGQPFTWTADAATGANATYFETADPVPHGTCNEMVVDRCDYILLEFSNPLTSDEIAAGKTTKAKSATVTIGEYDPVPDPGTDFDFILYASDPDGTKGVELAQGASGRGTGQETTTTSIRTSVTEPSKWVLVEVIYYTVVNTAYTGTARF